MRDRIVLAALVCSLIACSHHSAKQPGSLCGNGKIDPGEQCDDGAALNGANGDGCAIDCTFACADPTTDCPAAPACQVETCTAAHTCQAVTDPTQDGTSCGMGMVCTQGACASLLCGNGVLEAGEQCDFGVDNGPGTGCEDDCTFSCSMSPDSCSDGDPCNGTETCGTVMDGTATGQACSAGTPEADGTSCGTGQICINQACTAATCGDGFVTSPEECDDGNTISGDGCENDCTFSCVSTDPTRNCTPSDPCQGQGTCNDTTHTCSPGTTLPDNTSCGTGGYCLSGTCTQPVCGNGTVEPGEQCDDGAANGTMGDGCTSMCTYACVDPTTDCGSPPACEKWTCTASHACQAVADSTLDGTTCGSGMVCNNGSCAASGAVCGNGVVESGEQCDFGSANNGPGTGCESNCQYSCQTSADCSNGNPCDGTETCQSVMVGGDTGQKCYAGTPETDGTSCGTGQICISQVCTASTCGDGFVDASAGEQCEPPNTATCDANCKTIACGNGILQAGEQCDDGNNTSLDGCDASCKFEQIQRAIGFQLASAHDSYCSKDVLGEAIPSGSFAQSQLQSAIDSGISDGSITIEFDALGISDLTGTSDPGFMLGALGGTPQSSTNTTYSGASDLDWWYTVDPSSIDTTTRIATTQLSASIASKVLTTQPGEMSLTVSFVGTPVTFDIFAMTIRVSIGAASKPTLSSDGQTPGHLSTENLDPTLQSFETMGGTASTPTGEMCGKVTAQSLYNVNVPSVLTGSLACSQNYSTSNTLLDVFTSGCKDFLGTQVVGTQPDTSRDGATYVFQTNSSHAVTGCTRNGASDTLSDCLTNAAYTSLFKFATDRVIEK